MKLLIANPTYNAPGAASLLAQISLVKRHPDWEFHHFEIGTSLLATTFNLLWCHMLNLRESVGLTHFLMIHADVRPRGEEWFDTLLFEMEKNQGDVISAIIPIKDSRGVTSTAIDTDPWCPVRLTLKQVHEQLPESWTTPGLLVNTGLLLVDVSKPWVEQICFTINDKIEKDKEGIWRAYAQPEDWNFSRQCRALGARVIATRAVTVEHFGIHKWQSGEVWGDNIDRQNLPPQFRIETAQVKEEEVA
jgi:hypothetical protein